MANEAVSRGTISQALLAAARLVPVPPACVRPLLVVGVVLGLVGDTLLRAPGAPGLNMFLWVAAVAVAALVLNRRSGRPLDHERLAWLAVGTLFTAGFVWRDAGPLKLLALGCAVLTFALAAYRPSGSWVRQSGLLRYALAVALGTIHTWTAAGLALIDGTLGSPQRLTGTPSWRRGLAVARGLALAAPLVFVFGLLFMEADAVFAELISGFVQFDVAIVASHVILFCASAWLATGYLRGFLAGTEPAVLAIFEGDSAHTRPTMRPVLGITEVATVLGALAVLFLTFVIVQVRYLFGGNTLIQLTPDLTYAEYARRGFFELVFAVVLIVPVLLVADWIVERRNRLDILLFRTLAGVQVGLVLAIMVSALQRLRLYYESYGLTDARIYATTLLLWIGAMLVWFALTALRGQRRPFAFGVLASGLATVAILFAVSPDAVAARTNLARATAADGSVEFDVAYATSLSGDAVPLLIEALPSLSPDVQCGVARQLLRRWPTDRVRPLRSWNWSGARAAGLVRAQEARLRSFLRPDGTCGPTSGD